MFLNTHVNTEFFFKKLFFINVRTIFYLILNNSIRSKTLYLLVFECKHNLFKGTTVIIIFCWSDKLFTIIYIIIMILFIYFAYLLWHVWCYHILDIMHNICLYNFCRQNVLNDKKKTSNKMIDLNILFEIKICFPSQCFHLVVSNRCIDVFVWSNKLFIDIFYYFSL